MRTLFLVATATVFCNPASATNLLSNPDFDTDNKGWTINLTGSMNVFADYYMYGWTPGGTMGTGSGSQGLTVYAFMGSGAGSAKASQCLAVTSSLINAASVMVWPYVLDGIHTEQLVAFTTNDCSGNFLGTFQLMPSNPMTMPGQWYEFKLSNFLLPPNTASVRFELQAFYDGISGITADYAFDHAYFEPEIIFSNGFE